MHPPKSNPTIQGLSPLARGNLHPNELPCAALGTIPARAGEPCHERIQLHGQRDYPRSRGGTFILLTKWFHIQGLSPLARGNRLQLGGFTTSSGTIPARAGEPILYFNSKFQDGDYPRSRGGTFILLTKWFHIQGLSPLARGNRLQLGGFTTSSGTIPARAGEPILYFNSKFQDGDYPRSRGGTAI